MNGDSSVRIPNSANEFLLDVSPEYHGDRVFAKIYDITQFLPSGGNPTRTAHMGRVTHTVKGKNSTVYICDSAGLLNREKAVALAIAWFEGKTRNAIE